MRKLAFAGAIALALTGSAFAGDVKSSQPTVKAGFSLSESQIVRIKTMLRLTPAQEKHWPPVEAALREIARGNLSTASVRRLMVAAGPLINTLDDNQKRSALALARSMGVYGVAAAF